jgi:signal transduction histidine kinase
MVGEQRPRGLADISVADPNQASIGAGIGLFVAKQFIEEHGGRIGIESSCQSDRHGTIVRVFLPLHTV